MTIIATTKPANSVTVYNLKNPDHEQVFSCSPREAVIAAYAQSLGDTNTWDYEKCYGNRVRETKHGWSQGNFWARDNGKPPIARGKPEIIKENVPFKPFLNDAEKAIIAPATEGIVTSYYDVNEDSIVCNEHGRLVHDIVGDLNKVLPKMDWGADGWEGETFSTMYPDYDDKHRDTFEWPPTWKWLAIYAVTGNSEGHYVHVDVVHRSGVHQLMALYKTFMGMANAQLVANRTAILLGA